MAHYLIQAAYTPESWKKFMAKPQNRIEALQPVLKKLGGKMEAAWFCFGEYDIVGILDLPDNVSAGAFSVAASAGGGVKAIKTTPLMSMDEGMSMCKKAAGADYQPPK